MVLLANMTMAQGVLQYEDESQPNDVFSSSGNEAALILKCDHTIPLTFSSSMDKSAAPFRTEIHGSDSVYFIMFPCGRDYRGRVLTIMAPGFKELDIPIELQPKQLLTFRITNPDALVGVGCYLEHRNKGLDEIKHMNYDVARSIFLEGASCSDADVEENLANIALCDSLTENRQKGDEAFKLLDYRTASKYYEKVMSMNAYDNYASNRRTLCIQNYQQECAVTFKQAEYYYNEKEYDKAKTLYQKVVEQECQNMSLATDRINSISSLQTAKTNHARVLTYEYRKDVPIGLSYGKYNMHKVGGFFQIDFNSKIFDAIRSECIYGDEKFPEMNISCGWTIKIASPVWVYFGPGATGKMYYGTYQEKIYPTVGYGEDSLLDPDKTSEKDMKKANLAFAVSPVIGICAKYSYFALRITYQYRFSIQSKLDDFMGKQRLSVGVGVAF